MNTPAGPTWPTATDYTIVVQDPSSAFSDAELQRGATATDLLGMPLVASGQNAVVFRLDANNNKDSVAIRCFVKAPHEGAARYDALERHLAQAECPFVAAARWRDEGIFVLDHWWPIVIMPWVVGSPLNLVVEDLRDDTEKLRTLADSFRDTVIHLQNAGVAHGDLQHGNVLVDETLAIRLVDLDGVWVPNLTTGAPNETGHPNYQHPLRNRSHWGPHIDTFSALLIELSLRAIAADPELFRFAGGENLIFTKTDLEQVERTAVWSALASSPDPWVRAFTNTLAAACRQPAPLAGPYVNLIGGVARQPEASDAEQPTSSPPASLAPLPSSTLTTGSWWEDGAARTASSTTDPTPTTEPASTATRPSVPKNRIPAVGSTPPTTPPLNEQGAVRRVLPDVELVTPAESGARRNLASLLGANVATAGVSAGVVAGVLGSLINWAAGSGISRLADTIIFIASISLLLGGLLNSWQQMAARAWRTAGARFGIGGVVGTVAGLVALIPTGLIVKAGLPPREAFANGSGLVSRPLLATLAWVLVAVSVGAMIGLLRSRRAALSGSVGGFVGGVIGGAIFASSNSDFSRGGFLRINGGSAATIFAAAAAAAFVGVSIGLVSRTLRVGSLRVIEGRSRGVEILIQQRTATIGSGRSNTLVLENDPAVADCHVSIDMTGEQPMITAASPIKLDGATLEGTAQLQDGSVITIGSSFIRFNRKS